jgi:hypothetical protein
MRRVTATQRRTRVGEAGGLAHAGDCASATDRRSPALRAFAEPSDGLEPATPSLPWRFRGVTRVHSRSLATYFPLQIGSILVAGMRRETSRVSFLMCPFCVRALVPSATTQLIHVLIGSEHHPEPLNCRRCHGGRPLAARAGSLPYRRSRVRVPSSTLLNPLETAACHAHAKASARGSLSALHASVATRIDSADSGPAHLRPSLLGTRAV